MTFFLRKPFLRRVLDQKSFFAVFFMRFGDWGSSILLLLQETVHTLDSGIAVLSYTGIQMSISWTLGLQSIAQISTNKHDSGCQLFNKPVPTSSIIVRAWHVKCCLVILSRK